MANQQGTEKSREGSPVEMNSQSNTAQPVMAEESEAMKKWAELVGQVWADEKLKQRLLDNPAAVLQEHGIEVLAGVEIRVVENTEKVTYLTLPAKPAEGATQLTASQMAAVAGGRIFRFTNIRANASGVPSGPGMLIQ
jgi:hypothetical protein